MTLYFVTKADTHTAKQSKNEACGMGSKDHVYKSSNVVILIHGVGSATRGSIKLLAEPVLRNFSVKPENIHEFHWHQLAGSPNRQKTKIESRTSLAYLARVMAGFRGSMHAASQKEETLAERITARSLDMLGSMLLIGLMIMPLIMLYDYEYGVNILSAATIIWLEFFVAMVFAGFCLLFMSGAPAPWARRSFLVIARPILFMVYLPFTIPVISYGLFILAMGGCIALVFVFVAPKHIADAQIEDMAPLIYWLGPGAVFTFLALLFSFFFAPLLKVVADIVRYAGSSAYRERLHDVLARELDKILNHELGASSDGRRIFIVGHSLGSVIAVNSLLREDNPCGRSNEIVLITMGSPLRRFFSRFFPGQCPPPGDIARALINAGAIRAWVNVYRPLDPIGTRLETCAGDAVIQDVCTKQYHRIFITAHTNYWSDQKVATLAASVIGSLPAVSVRNQGKRIQINPLFFSVPPAPDVDWWQKRILWLLAPAAAGLMIISDLTWLPERELQRSRERLALIRERGELTTGVVEYKMNTVRGGSDRWLLSFQPRGSSELVNVTLHGTTANMPELTKYVGFNGLRQARVKVAYDVMHPSSFFLPDFAPPDELDGFRLSIPATLFRATWYPGIFVLLLWARLFSSVWYSYLGERKRGRVA
ncbi:hypothetical protein GBZ26_05220 [Azospirillum formosense]|uniref:Alpha/beta hydrolase n=1 Tax=Azospirillum formosense TaxID=861533 RepID=A0ABX2KPS6_9PROT|nr:hypothetical protein [Azospirillum formosense]MBY3753877.1 hypothetical protein [Azospirillum formosense]NUB18621.1 hypothetical protein [Azospirillum formosense]